MPRIEQVVNITITLPNNIEWTACIGSEVIMDGANAIWKGSTPPGWGENQDSPIQVMVTDVFRCDRVSWGSFERGPIFMIQEWQTNFQAPAACIEGGNYRSQWFMESIGFSDHDLAAYAREKYGLNAYATNATFVKSGVPGAPAETWSWTWPLPGGAIAKLNVHDWGVGTISKSNPVERVFWYNGRGISYMDFGNVYEHDAVFYDQAEGDFPAPMMWGTYGPISAFATARSFLEENESLSATISRFGDMACTRPL